MKAKKLLALVNYCGSIISRNPVVPILEYLFFKEGKIYAANLTAWVWASMGESCDTFLIPFAPFKKILAKLPGETDVQIYLNQSDIVKIKAGDFSFTLKTEDAKEFPNIPVTDSYCGMLTTTDIQNALIASKFVSNDVLRPSLTGVYLNNCICGTDGLRLFWKRIEGEVHPSFIIPVKSVKLLKSFEFAELYKSANSDYIELTNNEKGIITRIIDERFPEFKKVIPKKKQFKIDCILPRQEIIKALKMADETANKVTHQVKLAFTPNTVVISSEDLDFDTSFETSVAIKKATKFEYDFCNYQGCNQLDNCKTSIDKCTYSACIGFNARLLLSALEVSKEENVQLQLVTPQKAAVIDRSLIVMPFMLNQYA